MAQIIVANAVLSLQITLLEGISFAWYQDGVIVVHCSVEPFKHLQKA